MSQKRVELFYDVGSTNSYFALHLLKSLADKYNAKVIYQPFNLGYVFRNNNYVLMDEPKEKLSNRKRDLMRWAQRYDLPFTIPDRFPIKTSTALRAVLAARQFDKEEEFIFAVFAQYWEGIDDRIDQIETLVAAAVGLGIDAADFATAVDSPVVREELIRSTNEALDRGVFGAPSIVVNDELYWGKDRMEFVEDELKKL